MILCYMEDPAKFCSLKKFTSRTLLAESSLPERPYEWHCCVQNPTKCFVETSFDGSLSGTSTVAVKLNKLSEAHAKGNKVTQKPMVSSQ